MVLRNAGPQGGPGMPEWGMLPMPEKLLKEGQARHAAHSRCADERHQLRRLRAAHLARKPSSAGRSRWCAPAISSASTWTARSIRMEVSDEELARRRAAWTAAAAALRAGVRVDVHAAHPAGERGLRLRLPAHGFRGASAGAGDLLTRVAAGSAAVLPLHRLFYGGRMQRRYAGPWLRAYQGG